MGVLRKHIIAIVCLSLCSLVMLSCTEKNDNKSDLVLFQGVKLSNGAIIENSNGTYYNYNLENGKYKKIESDSIIGLYNNESGNYVGQIDGKYFSSYNGNKINLDNISDADSEFKLSKKGEKLSFFRNTDDINEVKILNISDGSEVEFKPQVLISGNLIDWVDDNKLIYYGINPDTKENGIFTYDLNDNKEELLYKFKNGDAQFLKVTEDGAVFVQELLDNSKILMRIDINTKETKILSENVVLVYDIVWKEGGYFVLGKFKDNSVSLYKIDNKSEKRMIFDYPSSIEAEKGIGVDDTGNLLIIGANKDQKQQEIYRCACDGTISLIKESSEEYNFVK